MATARVLAEGLLSQADIDQLHEEASKEVQDIEDFADGSDIARPTEEELLADVFAP
jgi:TPP-dependent pyruvate/acetoin dehydrogenase alpha subunit